MKKRVLSFLLILVMSVLCISCGKDKEVDQPVTDTENVVEDMQQEEPETEESSGRTKIEDEKIIASIKELIDAEKLFEVELCGTWPEYEGPFEINDRLYRLVDAEVATSWKDYEERAKAFYTDEYIKDEFTPSYTIQTKTFLEKDGRLYRAEADGIVLGIIENSIEIFESAENRLYVTFFVDAAGEEVERAFLVEPSEVSPYGYVIVEKINYVK